MSDGSLSVPPIHTPKSPSSSLGELSSPSIGLKLPTVPAAQAYSNNTVTLNKDGMMEYITPHNSLENSTFESELTQYCSSTKFIENNNSSAFHGVIPDPYKNNVHDICDAQILAFKQLFENGLSGTILSQQMLLQNQQLQLLFQYPEQWCNVFIQNSLSFFPNFSNQTTVNVSQQETTMSTNDLQNCFLSSNAKHKPSMYV